MVTVFKNFIIAVLMQLAGCGLLSAQSFDFGFKHLTTDNGLSHDKIQSIMRDNQGFLWFGTMNGLNRFDGMQFRVFTNKLDDSTSLIHNYITSTVCDQDGYIWVGTGEGLCRYDPHKQKFRAFKFQSKPEINIAQVGQTTDGRIYVIHDRKLFSLDSRGFSVTLLKLLPEDAHYARMFSAPKGNLWIQVRGALYLFHTKTNQLEYIMGNDDDHRDASPGIMTVYTDPHEVTWIGTWEAGLFRFDEQTRMCRNVSVKLAFIVSIVADLNFSENNLLWMSSGYAGLAQYNIKTDQVIEMPKHVQQPWSHNGGRVVAFFRDTINGILWVGSEFGLEKFDPSTEHFARKMLPSSGAIGQFPSVNGVIRDKTDTSGKTWWISSWVGGVYKWNRQTDELTSYSHKLYSHEVFDIQQDDEGNIWLAEWRGVQVFNPRTNQWKLIDSFIRNDTVSTKVLRLFKDSRGDMWIANNYDGLHRYDHVTKKLIRYRLASVLDKPRNIWVSCITEDSKGNIWLAGGYHTFFISPDGTIRELKLKSENGNTAVSIPSFSLAIDKKDNLWLVSQSKLQNITRDGKLIKVYNQQNGLMGTSPNYMLADQQGYIWVATENSLHRLNPETGHFRYYKKEDGLFSNNIMEPMTIADNGDLFVGFHNAFSYTNIFTLNHRNATVPFIFTGIQVEDRKISPIEISQVTLQPGENSLDVDFAALDFSKPEKIQYVYWMEGAENEWDTTDQRTLSFTNLSGGNYVLHLKVMGPNGVASKEELTLAIKVIPPFYRTWWFWMLVAFGLGSILYSFYHIRKEQRARLEKIRDRIATDLHDDMGSTLSSIRIFSDVAKNQVAATQPQVVPMLEKISNNASQLSDNMQDIIWTIKQDHDRLEDLVARIREFGLKLCDAKDIVFKVHISDSFKTSRLNLEQRRNLYLIFKECLNNAIKYSNCTIIQLFITQQRRHLKMVIEDNGKGFSEAGITKGNGLSNIRKRAQEIDGNATIESVPGKGTRIDILVDLH
ncbi:MAG TPA: two-component regulator propeller domain-containing protein [Chitinophagaceae bacterium]